jgi:hypothetical protein
MSLFWIYIYGCNSYMLAVIGRIMSFELLSLYWFTMHVSSDSDKHVRIMSFLY